MMDQKQKQPKNMDWLWDDQETAGYEAEESEEAYIPPYGDVTALNRCRVIMDSLGQATLQEIGAYAIQMLDTSVAIYEANGDYAFGMFSSGWCQLMDAGSRALCRTTDNETALTCGKWLCHENCWNDSAKKAIETGKSTDIDCIGGIKLYAEPIFAGKKVIGCINIGYGDPPDDPDRLQTLSDAFEIDVETLRHVGAKYRSRPPFVVNMAKRTLKAFAKLIGEIVEKSETEEKLSRFEKRNQALLDHSPLCHKIVDLDFNLKYMSANGFTMLKLDPSDETLYDTPYPFHFFPEPFKKEMGGNLKKVKERGRALTMEAKSCDIEGNDLWLESSLIPVLDREGLIDYITVVSADITHRKNDEKQRDRLEEKLAQAQKMEAIGNLAGGIAHDFNNILFPITGLSELMLDDLPKGSMEYENVQEILIAGRRGAELVKQILSFSRQYKHQMAPIRIQSILKEVLKLTRSTIPSYIEIKQDIKPDLDLIWGDAIQIHQIAMNIITNAYHAMEEKGGILTVLLKEFDLKSSDVPMIGLTPGSYAHLTISDTGHGIPAKMMEKIFDPYFTTKKKGKGTGLGLSVVHGIVKSHKGEISVYSEIGQGTTFNIYLPLMKKTKGPDSTAKIPPLATGHERILLVDDEPAVAELEKKMIERLGYKVTMCDNSIEALKTFNSAPDTFDLIISDMNMPNLPGDQLTLELKKIRPDIPILICTGFSERIDNEIAQEMGVSGILMKPVVRSEMAKMIRNVLDKQQQ